MAQTDNAPSSSWQAYFAAQAAACKTPALREFYTSGVPAEDSAIGDVRLMALDLETTGLDWNGDAIVSIGMVPFDLQTIRPAEGSYWVVKPATELTEESIAFHRITHSQVDAAPALEEIFPEVLRALAGHLVVVHYRLIERPFLDAAATGIWGENCLFPLIDTMSVEAHWQRSGKLQRVRRWLGGGSPSIRLMDSRARYGLPPYSSHHAKVDALATAELFMAQIKRHYAPQTPVARLWE
jgi:DNA polymerase III subunit epsilon